MEIGLYTLSELVTDRATGRRVSARRRLDETIAAARLADEAGLDLFARRSAGARKPRAGLKHIRP